MDNADLLQQLRINRDQREDAPGEGRPWLRIVAVVVVVALLLGGAAWWWFGQRAIGVQVAVAQAPSADSEAGAVLQATGYITARRQATVSAQITGTLTEVLIEEGDHVVKGQILARLDDSGYRADLNAAKAAEQAAHAQLAQWQAQLTQAKQDAGRLDTLAARGLVAKQIAEQARTAVVTAGAQLNAQRKQEQVARARAAAAQVNFDYTVVRAPFTGVIIAKNAQVGEILSPFSAGGGFTRTGVGTIVDMDSLEVDVDVNEAYIGRVKSNMPAEAVLDAYPDWKIPAHVIAIVPTADRGKATVKVRVALEQKDPRIVPDMGVRVSFLETRPTTTAAVPQGVLVPGAAIVQRGGQSVVFVLDGKQVRQRSVQPADQKYGDLRLLPAGVKAGDSVVLAPPEDLRDGSAVRVQKP